MTKYRAVAKFRIHEGKADEFRQVAAQCLEAVKLHDPQAREQAEDLIRKLLEAKAPKVTNKGVTNKGT